MKFFSQNSHRKALSVLLILMLVTSPVFAGILVAVGNGITITQRNGINYTGPTGLTTTGVGGVTYTAVNGLTATGVDGMSIAQASGLTTTGVDGLTITAANGVTYQAESVSIWQPSGLTTTGVDGLTVTGVDGLTTTGVDSRTIAHADGLTTTGVDELRINQATGLTATTADGQTFSISPNGVRITGVSGLTTTGVDNINFFGADSITDPVEEVLEQTGLQSLDPELATLLNQITDDSNVNAAIVYHRLPTESDIATLQRIGILGGTRYRVLPVISTTATRRQLVEVSRLAAVRSIYGVRTLSTLAAPGNGLTGVERVPTDGDLTSRNGGVPLSGRNVTVAVLDTGLDATHPDLAGRVVNNVKLISTLGVGAGFNYPVSLENQPTTDLVSGHGTFVAGVIAGDGSRSRGRHTGVAPGSKLLGLSAGELNLLFVLEGFDFLLARGAEYRVRVVNCSFSSNAVYDRHDPVNVATKLLTEHGISVVFSAGNSGPGLNTLNPYAMAPWVISVGATDQQGRLAGFSSRGDFRTPNARPTLVAPGVNVISLRATGLSLSGTLGTVLGVNPSVLPLTDLLFYTVGTGTSFSAPQVAGTIALMLEANQALKPAQIRDILQRSATLLPSYHLYEVGAGMLNAYAAVLEAAFPERRNVAFRATLDRGQARFIIDPVFRAAIAVVFAAGLRPEAEAQMNASLPVSDAGSIPAQWRGYVAVGRSQGLITPEGGAFNPANAFKRIELAHGMARLA
jgi:subtilisin family serine protease